MSDWSELEADAKKFAKAAGPRCQVKNLLDLLEPAAAAKVVAALDNRSLSAPALHRALEARVGDKAPTPWSIGNHRRGGCVCGRGK